MSADPGQLTRISLPGFGFLGSRWRAVRGGRRVTTNRPHGFWHYVGQGGAQGSSAHGCTAATLGALAFLSIRVYPSVHENVTGKPVRKG